MLGERRQRLRDAIVTPRPAVACAELDAEAVPAITIAARRREALRIAPPSPNRTERGRAARRRALACSGHPSAS